jgi:DNA-binding CsgD family transcriptional regulator/PAS domain-containing protein
MTDAERLSLLLRDIYDAALSPTRWADVVRSSGEYIHAIAASVVFNERAHFHFNDGTHPVTLWEERRKTALIRRPHRILREKEAISIAAALPREELEEWPFFDNWASPQGVRDILTYGFIKASSGSTFLRFEAGAAFALHRDEGASSDEALRRFQLIAPHMRRVALIAKAVSLGDAEAATFIQLLDGLRAGIFLIDAEQRLVHANVSGRELLALGEVVRIDSGRIVVNELFSGNTLDVAVGMAAKGGAASVGAAFTVPVKTPSGQCYVAHLLPLTAGGRRSSAKMYDSVAALILHRTELQASAYHQRFAEQYHLTPAEARVAIAIAQIGGIPEVANALLLAPNTVRTHLQRVFSKTDTRRQADLVKLVASAARPLLR